MMMELKQAEFFALTGGTDANTLNNFSSSGGANNSALDDPAQPQYASLRNMRGLDPTLNYNFFGYIWAAYKSDSNAWIRAQLRLSRGQNVIARVPLCYMYKQGSGSFSPQIPLTSAFTWSATSNSIIWTASAQAEGDLQFNPVQANGNSQGEGTASAGLSFALHPQNFGVPVDSAELDIISWFNIDARNVHAFIAALPVGLFGSGARVSAFDQAALSPA